MIWIAAHPYLTGLMLGLIFSSVSSVVAMFGDPDNNPATPPPKWVVPFIILQRVFTFVAPNGTVGIGGTRISIPVFHYPTESGAPPSSGAGPALVLVLASIALSGCAYAEKAYAATFESVAKIEQRNGDFAEQFPAFSRAKVKVITSTAPSEAEGNKALDEWKATAEQLVKMVDGTHASARLIRNMVVEIRAGLRSKAELAQWAGRAARLLPDLEALLAASGVHLEAR